MSYYYNSHSMYGKFKNYKFIQNHVATDILRVWAHYAFLGGWRITLYLTNEEIESAWLGVMATVLKRGGL